MGPVGRVLGWVVTFLPLVSLLVGARHLALRSRGERLLWWWLVVVLAQGGVMAVLSARGIPNSFVAQLNLPILVGLGVHALATMMVSPRAQRSAYLAFAVFVPIWLWRESQLDFRQDFAVVVGPLGHLVFAWAAMLLIRDRLAHLERRALRDPVLVTGLAVLVIYAPMTAIAPVARMIWTVDASLTLTLYLIRAGFLLVGYLLFIPVFLWTIPSRSSPGLSWSRARVSESSLR